MSHLDMQGLCILKDLHDPSREEREAAVQVWAVAPHICLVVDTHLDVPECQDRQAVPLRQS